MGTVTEVVYGVSSNGYPEVKDWITYGLAFVGIGVTAYYSRMIYLVTKKSTTAAERSVQVAEDSLQFHQLIIKRQDILNDAVSHEYLKRIKEKVFNMITIVSSIATRLRTDLIINFPKEHGLTEVEFSQYFSLEQKIIINTIWDEYCTYVYNYWTDHETGKIKTGFNGNTDHILLEAAMLHERLKTLFNRL
jgi:hypothetical protein